MEIKHLNKTLKDEAMGLGMCVAWQRLWRNGWKREELVQRFKDGIDFCIQHDFPKNDFIKENFPRDLLRSKCILVDDAYSLLNERSSVLQGTSRANIRFNAWNVGTVYVRHDSSASITARNMSAVIVHLFDNARVECETYDKGSVVVIRHGENTAVDKSDGNVRICEEFGYLTVT